VLELNSETVRYIIERAKEFQSDDVEVVPEEQSTVREVEDEHPSTAEPDPARAELESVIADLEPDQQIELVALMWLGRGDYDIAGWEEAKLDAAAEYNARTASYLIGTPLLADFLEEGLALHETDED
jgi:Protein of unknown function (DUF3775)